MNFTSVSGKNWLFKKFDTSDITNFSEKCMLKLNKSYKTTNLNGTLKLDSLKNRTDFIKSCTENGAYVIYDSKATRFTEKNLISFIKKNMSQN